MCRKKRVAQELKPGPLRQRSQGKGHQGDRYATPDSTRGRIDDGSLRADHRRLFMLCCAAQASDVLITRLLLNDRACFAHVNCYEHSLNSPTSLCVSITLPASS